MEGGSVKMSKSVLPLCCALLVLLTGCVPMNPLVAHEYTDPNPHWKEEVALVDGGRIIVDRSQTYGRGGYLGEGRIIGRRTLDFTHPATGQKIHWEGDEHVIPMLLDFKDGTPYLAAKPFSCNSFQKLGSPLPPYVLYKYTGRLAPVPMSKVTDGPKYQHMSATQKYLREPPYQSPGWERIPMAEFPETFSKVNLVLDGYKMHKIMEEPAYMSADYVTAELVRKYYSNYKPNTMVLRSGKKGAESCVADQEGEIGNMMDDVKPEDWEARLREHHPDPAEHAYYQSILERLLKRHREMEWVLDHVKPEELEAYMNRTYKDWWDRSDHYRTLIEIKQTRQAKERK